MKKKYSLDKNWIDKLSDQPESGMGYQVVSVATKDGKLFQNVMILGCNEIAGIYGYDHMPFDIEDIENIQVTHLRKPPDFDQKKWFYIDR